LHSDPEAVIEEGEDDEEEEPRAEAESDAAWETVAFALEGVEKVLEGLT
jgi:hypothetical protein